MIIGQYSSKLTDRDRIAVPKKFREDLGNKIIVAKWYESCLVLVSEGAWAHLLSRITGETKLVIEPIRNIDRFILGSAFEFELDSQGRFIIPDVLKEHGSISQDVVFLGLGDRIEIWAKEKWESLEKDLEGKASESLENINLINAHEK